MGIRRLVLTGAAIVLAGLAGCGGAEPKSAATEASFRRALTGAPAPLAGLYRRPGQLLEGGPSAFRRQIADLRGYPVVVNKWASWCGPCRSEFPYFQHASKQLGRRVAFIGVNSSDNEGDAAKFLKQFPVPYPSYVDHSTTVAQVFKANLAFPTTAFYDAGGKLQYIHQGEYPSQAKLLSDIKRYAG